MRNLCENPVASACKPRHINLHEGKRCLCLTDANATVKLQQPQRKLSLLFLATGQKVSIYQLPPAAYIPLQPDVRCTF